MRIFRPLGEGRHRHVVAADRLDQAGQIGNAAADLQPLGMRGRAVGHSRTDRKPPIANGCAICTDCGISTVVMAETPLRLELVGRVRTEHELRPQPEGMGVLGRQVLGIVEIVLEVETGELGQVPGQQRRQAVAVVAERVFVVADRNEVLVQAVVAAPDVLVAQAARPTSA